MAFTTERAARLVGLAMCLFALVKAGIQQTSLYLQRVELAHLTGGFGPHEAGSTFFIIINLLEPAPWLLTGLLLIFFSRRIQRLLG